MSGVLFDQLTSGLRNVLDLRSQQHALTASNLANAETPGYRAKQIDFDRVLGDALGASNGLPLKRTDARHLSAYSTLDPQIEHLEATPWSVDGNSVLPEREQARLQENSLMYRAVARGLSRRLAMLKYAASDGR